MLDPDEEDRTLTVDGKDDEEKDPKPAPSTDAEASSPSKKTSSGVPIMSAALMSLPGMKDLMMKKAGKELPSQGNSSGNHFVEEIDINDYQYPGVYILPER